VFNIGNTRDFYSTYFDQRLNQKIFEKVAKKCYLPTNNLILDLIRKYNGKFRVSYSLTGTFVEYCEKYLPEHKKLQISVTKVLSPKEQKKSWDGVHRISSTNQ